LGRCWLQRDQAQANAAQDCGKLANMVIACGWCWKIPHAGNVAKK
jgi:hypothetical protein